MKIQTKQKIVYARYIFPVVLLLILLAVSLVPAYQYVTSGDGGGLSDKFSYFDLVGNYLESSRNALFGTEMTDEHILDAALSKNVLIIEAIGLVCFLVSLAVSVYSLIMAMKYFLSDDEDAVERQRTFFITLFPNRIVLCVFEFLAVLPFLFPYILPILLEKVYASQKLRVTMAVVSVDPIMVAAVGFLILIVLSCVCAPLERQFDADLFKKRGASKENGDCESDEEVTDEQVAELSEEQNEFIRRLLLSRNEKNNDSDIAEDDNNGDE